jgi:hypothetical protein
MAGEPPEISNFESKLNAVSEIVATNDDPRFAPDEMVVCGDCSRSNPPVRATCLYCGGVLAADKIDLALAKVNFQRPDTWEDGFSLVYSGESQVSEAVMSSAAEILQTSSDDLAKMLNAGAGMPLVYLRSLPDSGLLGSRLSDIGFQCAVVGDDLLQADVPPTRVRRIRFDESCVRLEAFNTGAVTEVQFAENVLIVAGALVKTSTTVAGKMKKGAVIGGDETLSYADEQVIDIYPEADVYGFRIRPAGFDFSCLGPNMHRLASTNMAELVAKLRSCLTSVKFIDNFRSASPLLNDIWPLELKRQSSEIKRGTFGGVRKQTLTVFDNSHQFTKFSRMQRHFV